ncbi:glycosyltransferase family 2 protein [bacterium]|nr:glycosyltransferase family 2 protein [bacterium]
MVRIAYLVPAYNAADTLASVLKGLSRYQPDVAVVDDGSTDQTGRITDHSGVTVLSHARNRGKGAALKTGFRYLIEQDYDWIVTLDADGQHDLDDIPGLLETCHRAEQQGAQWGMVIGSRFAARDLIPRYRYYPNRIGQLFLRWLTGQQIEDTQSGFRVYRVRVLKQLDLCAERFALETEVILKTARLGYQILFTPIQTIYPEHEREKTNFRPFVDTYRISLIVLKEIWWRLNPFRFWFGSP